MGAWIEISLCWVSFLIIYQVAPCVGAWIEIDTNGAGLSRSFVAPCVGAWIEISSFKIKGGFKYVAPCVGAWIEISCEKRPERLGFSSLLAWERGLK